VTKKCHLKISQADYDVLWKHLFPGDGDEHGAVLLAGLSTCDERVTLCVREVHLAKEGVDYVAGKIGYRALAPQFIHKLITRARDQRLVYLAVHNHASDREVGFSRIDIASHERGYPALLQISRGMPVGALVLGLRSMQADLWISDGSRCSLDRATIVGSTIVRIAPSPKREVARADNAYDRQIRMFGSAGQAELAEARIAIVGLGGIGSLVAEYLAKLGVGNFTLVDNDHVEESNLSRIVGATSSDAINKVSKVEVARRLIAQINNLAKVKLIKDDVAKDTIAREIVNCDYIFLAADSMRARLVINAIVHQYLVPGVQLGSKIRSNSAGELIDIMSANRPLRPGQGCLWCNQLIDQTQLSKEAKTDDERKSQAYGVEEPNPSVISLNAISASHAVNDFLLDYLSLRADRPVSFEHNYVLSGKRSMVVPRQDAECSECSHEGDRYGRADLVALPCIEAKSNMS